MCLGDAFDDGQAETDTRVVGAYAFGAANKRLDKRANYLWRELLAGVLDSQHLEPPSSGVVRISGVDAARLSDGELSLLRAQEIGFIFQQFFLAEHATVRENVADGLLYAGVPAAERYRRADDALERGGLSGRANFKPTRLSGGERQRVAIARALVGRSAIVLADEPTGNLDSTTGASIIALIRELNADGATIIMITHDAGLADQLPRQIRVLDGQVVADIPAATTATRCRQSTVRRAKGEVP